MEKLKTVSQSLAGITSWFFATMCWVGPVILAFLGLGTFGLSFFERLAPFRPIFILIGIFSMYKLILKIEKKDISKGYKIFIYSAIFIMFIFIMLPIFINLLVRF